MKKIILIDNYDSFTFNLYHYLSSLKVNVDVIRNDQITSKEILRRKYNKIVISPGPGNPYQSGNCLKIVKSLYKKLPILGVCLGHQCIVEAFGGEITYSKELMHGKTSSIEHDKEVIYKDLENPIVVGRYHSLAASGENLPEQLRVTAKTKNGEIMGVRHINHDIEGVQFHPESIMTKDGMAIMKNFLNLKE